MNYMMRMSGTATLAAVLAAHAWAGYIFDAKVIHSVPGQNTAQEMQSTVRYYVDGDKGRMEVIDGRFPALSNTTYLVTRDGGQTTFRIDPTARTCMPWDIESLMGMAPGSMNMVTVNVSHLTVDTILDEAGPETLGFSTRHRKISSAYALDISCKDIHQTTRVKQQTELWVAPTLVEKGFNLWINQQKIKTGNDQADAAIGEQLNRVRGTPLKQVTTTLTRKTGGGMKITRSSREIVSFKRDNIPGALFEIPANVPLQTPAPAGTMAPGTNKPPDDTPQPEGTRQGKTTR